MPLTEEVENCINQVLDAAVVEGYLTPMAATEGPAHSAGFLGFLATHPLPLTKDCLAVDLGTGGGVPGLILAALTPCRWIFVDRGNRRCQFLTWAVRELSLEGRVEVKEADAVDFAHGPQRGQAKLVTARSFASPASTAECGGPLLARGGYLVVSEPPDNVFRWPEEELKQLGLAPLTQWHNGRAGYQALTSLDKAEKRFPRRFSRQTGDPLF
ncbi:MAG TPA: hypothetical protein EYG34_01485 [Acidimicrobiia bacterium]|nr:hypothetical protein [Acidimicrobiia bacterium]HIL45778.1 hypothetical protein [Acidimicrobiia bacterium]